MIPEAAVEAAARARYGIMTGGGAAEWGYLDKQAQDDRLYWMRAALEAAAPHMVAMNAVSAVLELHREMECRDEDNEPVGGSYCEECKDLDDHSGERVHEIYPCLTVREITAALAGTQTFTAMRNHIERTTK